MSSSIRVIVADANQNFRRLLADLLQHEGYEVEAVDDGEALVRAGIERPARVIVADVRLLGLPALDALRRLRRAAVTAPVILMTGGRADDVRDEAIALGVVFVLEKPFGFDALRDAVHACVGS